MLKKIGQVWNFICRKEERKTLSKKTITIFKNRFTYNKPKGYSEACKRRIIVKDKEKNYRLDL
jgi:hypothetical protein